MTQPTIRHFTMHFENRGDAIAHLRLLGYRPLPVKGVIERWHAVLTGDDGEKVYSFASGVATKWHITESAK